MSSSRSSSSTIKRGSSGSHLLQPYQMSSSSHSYPHFSHGQSSPYHGEIRFCHCGHRAALRTSRTQRNMGRRFLGCALYGIQPACGFFEWVDGEIELVPKLLDRIDVLERELKLARGRERCYLRVLLGTWAGIVFLFLICYLLISWTPVDVLKLP